MTDLTTTTKLHRATPQQWSDAGAFGSDTRACLYDLRSRVEALEAQQPAPCPHIVSSDEGSSYCSLAEQQAQPAAPAGDADETLIWQVAGAIAGFDTSLPQPVASEDCHLWRAESCDVIRVIARWLRANGWIDAADRLEQEAGR